MIPAEEITLENRNDTLCNACGEFVAVEDLDASGFHKPIKCDAFELRSVFIEGRLWFDKINGNLVAASSNIAKITGDPTIPRAVADFSAAMQGVDAESGAKSRSSKTMAARASVETPAVPPLNVSGCVKVRA